MAIRYEALSLFHLDILFLISVKVGELYVSFARDEVFEEIFASKKLADAHVNLSTRYTGPRRMNLTPWQ